MKLLLLLSSVFLVTGCATSLSDEQIMAMDDKQLCAAVAQNPEELRLVTFMGERGLECHPAQITCTKAGFKKKTEKYNFCVQSMIQEEQMKAESRRQAWQAFGKGMQQAGRDMQAHKPVTTNCYGGAYNVSCTTY